MKLNFFLIGGAGLLAYLVFGKKKDVAPTEQTPAQLLAEERRQREIDSAREEAEYAAEQAAKDAEEDARVEQEQVEFEAWLIGQILEWDARMYEENANDWLLEWSSMKSELYIKNKYTSQTVFPSDYGVRYYREGSRILEEPVPIKS